MYQPSMVFTGILSRTTVKWSFSAIPRLAMVSFTFVPLGPLSLLIISSRLIFTPAIAVSFTAIMRSPDMMPTFSEGPFATVCITSNVSSCMLNCMPTPSNEPLSDSFMALVSLAVV